MNPGTVEAGDRKFRLSNFNMHKEAYGNHETLNARIMIIIIRVSFFSRFARSFATLPTKFGPC